MDHDDAIAVAVADTSTLRAAPSNRWATLARTRLAWLVVRATIALDLRPSARAKVHRLAGPVIASGDVIVLGGLVPGLRLSGAHFDTSGALAYGQITGTHEPMVQEALRRTLRPDGVFLDLGAGTGTFSLIAAAIVGDGGRVASIDPLAENVDAIKAHAAANGFRQITTVTCAVGRARAVVEMIEVDEPMWAATATVIESSAATGRRSVPVTSVDDLIDTGAIPEPDVVKVDVEGSEIDVLDGMRRLVERRPPVLIVEMHDRNREFVARAERVGYRVTNLDGPEPVASAGPNVHAICTPGRCLAAGSDLAAAVEGPPGEPGGPCDQDS